MVKHSCFICGSKRQRNLRLAPCARIPRHIVSFEPVPENYILTLVCMSCLNSGASREILQDERDIFSSSSEGYGERSPCCEVDE